MQGYVSDQARRVSCCALVEEQGLRDPQTVRFQPKPGSWSRLRQALAPGSARKNGKTTFFGQRPAMFFAQAPRITRVAANLPQSGLEAPFDYGAPFNGDRTSIANKKHARKAHRSCDVRL